jgi:multisubunit Na+/H+ antiporter MnhB subunit
MADNGRILWGRTFVASLAMELVLGIVTVALFNLQDNPNATLDIVIPILALVLFIPAGKWAAKPAPGRAILNGALAGFWGIVMYVLLTLYMRGAVADFDFESSLRPAYMLAHALKVVGGAIGGWLLIRKGA